MDHRTLSAQEGRRCNAPISIREVAAHAGVSVGTVSNVLNRPDIVAQPTRDRVHAAIKALGFVRNESARQLRAGRSRTIGLVVLDVANPFFTDVARGVEDEASMSGLSVILCNSDEQLPKETRYLELLEEHRVQGILITPVRGRRRAPGPAAAAGHPGDPGRQPVADRGASARWPSMTCSAATSPCRTCWRRGHERIAFVGGPLSLRQVADRHEGAIRALQRAGGAAATCMIETPALNVSAGQRAGAAIAELPAGQRPTAAFCANDLVALGAAAGDDRRQIRVPEDVAIVGYDDIEFAAAAAVPLSSVRQPRQQLGPHRRSAAAGGGTRRRRAPAPSGDLPAGARGAPVQPGPPRAGPAAGRRPARRARPPRSRNRRSPKRGWPCGSPCS